MTKEQLLRIRLEMERIITERESMIAFNAYRIHRVECQVYDAEAFIELADRLNDLIQELSAKGWNG